MKKYFLIYLILLATYSYGQQRDTLRLKITKVDRTIITDTVYNFTSRVDTIALQPIKTDTGKIVKDINPQDLEKSKYNIRIMGSVRINSYYDLNGMTSTEGFLPYDIPVGEASIPGLSSAYIGARQSRLGIEGTANTKVGKIRTYMEVDFASSTESFWRLRHAFAEWNYFKLGYTWTTFMDNASLPVTVDFEGPNSSLSKRHGIIRYERKHGERSIIGISAETPQADYFNPADSLIENKNIQGNFDVAGRYKLLNSRGHVQIAGIFRRIAYLNQDNMDKLFGWGILLSSSIRLNDKNRLYAQYSVGSGIANYYVGFTRKQLDAVYNPATLNMELKFLHGGFITYMYNYNQLWNSSFTYGISLIEGKAFEPDDSFRSSQYVAANVFYKPLETVNLGFEVTYGQRTNLDNEAGDATRFSVIAKFDF